MEQHEYNQSNDALTVVWCQNADNDGEPCSGYQACVTTFDDEESF